MNTSFSSLLKFVLISIGILVSLSLIYYKMFMSQNNYKFNYFQTVISINLGDEEKSLPSKTLNQIDKLLKDQDAKWSTKNSDTLKKLNSNLASGESFTTDDEVIEVINKLKDFHISSKGYFNPTIGKLVNYWGTDGDKSLNLDDYLNKLPKPDNIQIDNKNLINSNPFLQLNINGIITGHVLTKIKNILVEANVKDAEISMGNDLYIIKSDNNNDYRIVTKSTSSKKMSTIYLKVYNDEFLSTSGIFIKDLNNIVRTIIDPNTGKPANGFYGSIVIDKDPYNANVASIALIIAGNDNYKSVASSLGIDNYILYTYDNKIILSDKMKERL